MRKLMPKFTLFISDLHLSPETTVTTQLLLRFLRQTAPQADALYILGDLFKFWVGDDDVSEYVQSIKSALLELSKKIPIYLMSGNRDFLLGQKFAHEAGCTLLNDPCAIDLYGKATVLTHGDMLCTNDVKYIWFRRIIHFPYGIKLFLHLPYKWRYAFARTLQHYTTRSKQLKTRKILIPQIPACQKFLAQFNATQLIHGHTHIEEIAEFPNNQLSAKRFSLGEWTVVGRFLIYYQNGTYNWGKLQAT